MNHIEKAEELSLLQDDFVVVGGSVLDIYGIRKSDDFDVVVSPNAFEQFKNTDGWKIDQIFKDKWGRERLVMGDFEVSKDLVFEWGNGYTFTFEMLKSISHIIDGVRVQPLAFLLLCKVHIGRPKDIEDVKLIEQYFATLNV